MGAEGPRWSIAGTDDHLPLGESPLDQPSVHQFRGVREVQARLHWRGEVLYTMDRRTNPDKIYKDDTVDGNRGNTIPLRVGIAINTWLLQGST